MTAAASLANHALDLGYNVGLITNGVSSVSASRSVVLSGTGPSQLTMLLESLAMVHPIGVRTLDELARSRRGAIPPGATLIHVGGIYHPRTMAYLLGLKRIGHPVILFHTGREDPPDYPDFEVRDGRSMFLDDSNISGPIDFQRPSTIASEWDELPVSAGDSKQGDR